MSFNNVNSFCYHSFYYHRGQLQDFLSTPPEESPTSEDINFANSVLTDLPIGGASTSFSTSQYPPFNQQPEQSPTSEDINFANSVLTDLPIGGASTSFSTSNLTQYQEQDNLLAPKAISMDALNENEISYPVITAITTLIEQAKKEGSEITSEKIKDIYKNYRVKFPEENTDILKIKIIRSLTIKDCYNWKKVKELIKGLDIADSFFIQYYHKFIEEEILPRLIHENKISHSSLDGLAEKYRYSTSTTKKKGIYSILTKHNYVFSTRVFPKEIKDFALQKIKEMLKNNKDKTPPNFRENLVKELTKQFYNKDQGGTKEYNLQ